MDVVTSQEVDLKREYWLARYPSKIPSLLNLKGDTIYNITQLDNQQPPIQYRIEFIKFVIKQLECRGSNDDADDETSKWYELLEDLTRLGQSEPFYRLYDIGLNEENSKGNAPIKIYEECNAFVKNGSTGFVTWIASLELAKWLTIDHLSVTKEEEDDEQKTKEEKKTNCCSISWAFELGCGTGFLAIALIKKFHQLKHYVATDLHHGVLTQCESNVLGNKLNAKVEVKNLDWVQDQHKFQECFQSISNQYVTPGVLLGADVIFDTSVVESLRKIVQSFLAQKPIGRVFLSSAIRNQSTFDAFCNEIRENNLEIIVVHTWETSDAGRGIILEIKNKNLCS